MNGWVLWFTGLPGSGKSTIAKQLFNKLEEEGIDVEYLRMDEIGQMLIPDRKYTEEERNYCYRVLALLGKYLTRHEVNVITDSTSYKKVWRDTARELIPNFAEIYIRCPLEICMERESHRGGNLIMNDLYKKSLERLRTGKNIEGLGEVVGVDVSYEEPVNPELIIDSDKLDIKESSDKLFELIKTKFKI